MQDEQKVTREAFATEQDWITWLQQLAAEHRMPRREQSAASHSPGSTLDRVILRRIEHRAESRAYYARHRTECLAYRREHYWTHHEEVLASQRTSYRVHRDKRLAAMLAQRMSNPSWVPREVYTIQARELEVVVTRLRSDGYAWREIATLTHRPLQTCTKAYWRAQRRAGTLPKKYRARCDDATLLATYHEGMTWAELARQLSYASPGAAQNAYLRALDRATRPDTPPASGAA